MNVFFSRSMVLVGACLFLAWHFRDEIATKLRRRATESNALSTMETTECAERGGKACEGKPSVVSRIVSAHVVRNHEKSPSERCRDRIPYNRVFVSERTRPGGRASHRMTTDFSMTFYRNGLAVVHDGDCTKTASFFCADGPIPAQLTVDGQVVIWISDDELRFRGEMFRWDPASQPAPGPQHAGEVCE